MSISWTGYSQFWAKKITRPLSVFFKLKADIALPNPHNNIMLTRISQYHPVAFLSTEASSTHQSPTSYKTPQSGDSHKRGLRINPSLGGEGELRCFLDRGGSFASWMGATTWKFSGTVKSCIFSWTHRKFVAIILINIRSSFYAGVGDVRLEIFFRGKGGLKFCSRQILLKGFCDSEPMRVVRKRRIGYGWAFVEIEDL